MSYTKADVVKRSEKEFDVAVGKHVIGTSKSDTDARFHMHAINEALEAAFDEGYQSAIDLVATGEKRTKQVQESGGRCKNCHGFTTYTRQDTHGLCMKCEDASEKMRGREFCVYCGAGIGKFRRNGEGTCPLCQGL